MENSSVDKQIWIVDCNPGLTDVLTFLYLFSPKENIQIKAITISHGKHDIESAAKQVLNLASNFNQDIQIYKGSNEPLVQEKITLQGHKTSKVEIPSINADTKANADNIREEYASAAIARIINENPGKVNILCLGPLTNVALAYHLDVTIAEKANRVVIVGGAIHQTGNLSKSGELNFASDPHAAALTITAFGEKCTIIPWEVSMNCLLSEEAVKQITGESNQVTKYLNKLNQNGDIKLQNNVFGSLAGTMIAFHDSLITDKITTFLQVESQSPETLGQLLLLWPVNFFFPMDKPEEMKKMKKATVVKDMNVTEGITTLTENLLSYKQ